MIDNARPHTITTAAPTHIKSQFALDPIENREERCCFLRFPDKCSFAVSRDSLDGDPSSFSLDAKKVTFVDIFVFFDIFLFF